jgi:hypothetical protein
MHKNHWRIMSRTPLVVASQTAHISIIHLVPILYPSLSLYPSLNPYVCPSSTLP